MQESLSHGKWGSENKLQLPYLHHTNGHGSSAVVLGNPMKTGSVMPHPQLPPSTSIQDTIQPQQQLHLTTSTRSPASTLQTKHSKPLAHSLKVSQTNYSALRQQRLVLDKKRAYESQALSVNAQSYRQSDIELTLEMVRQAQSAGRSSATKSSSKHSCATCSVTTCDEEEGNNHSSHLPDVNNVKDQFQDTTEETSRKALIVQLPNILYSRANTPAAVDRGRSALAINRHRLNNTPAERFSLGADLEQCAPADAVLN